MNYKKIGSFILLTVMSSPLFVWAGGQLIRVAVHEERIEVIQNDVDDIEEDIDSMKEKVDALYWAQITRKGLRPPKGK